ncbi:hypothetical protein D3C78_1736240 [compost metagenome]
MAPLIKTVWPDLKPARNTNAAHDDIAGLAIAAAVRSSIPSGKRTTSFSLTTVCSAKLPYGAVGSAK